MKAYRIAFALLFLIFYSSYTQDDFLSEQGNFTESNTNITLIEDSRATQSSSDLVDFFRDYDFDYGMTTPLERGVKMITNKSRLYRNNKVVTIYESGHRIVNYCNPKNFAFSNTL